jgi:hypothetical protein
MSQPLGTAVAVRRRSPVWFWVNWLLALAILIPACGGFVWKFRELVLLYDSFVARQRLTAAQPSVAGLQPQTQSLPAPADKLERRHFTTTEAEDGGFAVAPILNYLFVSLGFLLLFLAAIAQGMFRDIEQPKRDLLAREQFLDQLESTGEPATVSDVASVR